MRTKRSAGRAACTSRARRSRSRTPRVLRSTGRCIRRSARFIRRWLAGRPVTLLGFREQTTVLLGAMARLGIRTLGEIVKLGRGAMTDRFGAAGGLAHELACGEDSPLCPRSPLERLEESMEVGDAGSGGALDERR